ncbi:hypothetical protein Ddye_022956 [Dipteronia dyeriana]|uniref:TF-B3 domain-containing protein n=1 Tax=Dipteronia dyeriana TaxID=168575 RepID=A0AAD9WSS9_9ROSI|nr:hypothetical protein Ddye_022956 [Dipteronia dyeriana]
MVPVENRKGEEGLLSVGDFVERGVKIDPEWTAFEKLLAAAEVASQKHVEEEKIRKKKRKVSDHQSCTFKSKKALEEKLLSSAISYSHNTNSYNSEYTKRSSGSHKSDCQRRSRNRQTGPDQKIPVLPECFVNRIDSLKGTHIRFVIEKVLYESDVNGNSRLSIPERQVRQEFLTEDEIRGFDRDLKIPLWKFIEPSCTEMLDGIMLLNRWKMEKENGTITYQYVLIGEWTNVRTRNGLKVGDQVQVWSFRIQEKLCLALVEVTN